jgi:hypothetical protein
MTMLGMLVAISFASFGWIEEQRSALYAPPVVLEQVVLEDAPATPVPERRDDTSLVRYPSVAESMGTHIQEPTDKPIGLFDREFLLGWDNDIESVIYTAAAAVTLTFDVETSYDVFEAGGREINPVGQLVFKGGRGAVYAFKVVANWALLKLAKYFRESDSRALRALGRAIPITLGGAQSFAAIHNDNWTERHRARP